MTVQPASHQPAAAVADAGAATLFWIDRLASHTPSRFAQADLYVRTEAGLTGASCHEIDTSVWIESIRRHHGASDPADLLLALVAVYLVRTTGNQEIALGYVDAEVMARRPPGANEPLGFVPLYLAIEREATFGAVLAQVARERQMLAAAAALPVGLLDHPDLATARDLWSAPLPVAVVVADEAPAHHLPAEISVVIAPECGRLRLHLGAPFDPALAERLEAHLATLATSVAADPQASIMELAILPADERATVTDEWNRTAVARPFAGGLIAQLEATAAAIPDQPALIFQETSITYGEFNRRVNQLAHHFRAKGVGKDVFVGLCMERSAELVIAIWAILKAGGAYVPLNPDDPPQRLAATIDDAGVRLLVTQSRFLDLLATSRIEVKALDAGADPAPGHPADNPSWTVGPCDLAYMIYTSGSTGRPKGVLIEHEAIFNRIAWMQAAYGLTADDRVMQKTPYTFDVSVWEFLWPLTVGATLVVADPGGHTLPRYMVELIRAQRVTVMHFVPSMLRLFLVAPGLRDLPLRMVFCSGEALSSDLQEQFLTRVGAELHNLYGPTEAAVDVSYWHCRADQHAGPVPIGKPIDNIRLHVLDERLRPVPIGTPGELHIGGAGLARGYWNRPDLTAERFIPDPIAGGDERLYKTGDLARFLRDGNLEYLGRNDHQVKINGLRIELGEIEAAIRAQPGIRDTVVVAREVGPSRALVGYLVSDRAGDEALAALEAALLDRLPAYMVPRTFVFLDAMPLTTSGKVDRKALPDPD